MKILFLTRLYHPHIGGIERHIHELSKVLAKKHHRIKILTTKYDKNLPDRETPEKTEVIRFPQPSIKYLGIIYTWIWLYRNKNLIEKSDIIHVHDVFIWYWPFKFMYPQKPVYITFHGQWANYPLTTNDRFQKRIGSILATGVISIGSYINRFYKIKSDVVSYGAASKNSHKLVKTGKKLVFVGRMDPNLPMKKYFQVISKLKGYKVTFCGDGKYSEEALKYGTVLGFTDPAIHMAEAKVCLAMGYLTVLEALNSKCLVAVCFENPLQEYYYGSAPFAEYIIGSSDPKEIVRKINHYLKNKKEGDKLIEDGYNWAKAQTWEKMAEKYELLWNTKK